MQRVSEVMEVPRLTCPYCGAGREYGGTVIPRDDCCLPRAAEQLGWITAYLAEPRQVRRLDARDPEVVELAETARHLRRVLTEAERAEPGAVRYALAAVEELHGRGSTRHAQAVRAARGIGGAR